MMTMVYGYDDNSDDDNIDGDVDGDDRHYR